MSGHLPISLLRITAACCALMLSLYGLAKETDPGGKDADTDTEIVFEPTSEGAAAARSEDPPQSKDADEPIDFDAKRPSILGMTVVEDADGRALVVDVGASSPAWDAGIREDDVIVSLHGVKAKSFQEWANSVRKVVADTKAGQTIPVQVLRDGSPLDLQVRISEQKGVKPPRPLKSAPPNLTVNQTLPTGEPSGVPYPVGGGVGFGPVAGGFADGGTASDQAPSRAVAQLMAVNNRADSAPGYGPDQRRGSRFPRRRNGTGDIPSEPGECYGNRACVKRHGSGYFSAGDRRDRQCECNWRRRARTSRHC
jgi:PDZ domain